MLDRTAIFQNRKHAAYHLGERLTEYENTKATVVAVSGGGIHIGAYLANLLNLPLEVIPCKKIKHPAYDNKTIGAVCADAVVIHEENNNIPQDYIYHQIQLLRHVIEGQNRRFNKGKLQEALKDRTIILVDDVLMTGDTMAASLKTVRKYQPAEVIMAIAIITPEGARAIADEIDKMIYLTIEPQPVGKLFADFPDVSEEEVLAILQQSRKKSKKTQTVKG